MIDASIYNLLRPPQFADPLDQQAKAANLVAMRQQAALAPLHQAAAVQQIQTGQMENQQRQQAIADDAAGRKLFSEIQGGAMPADAEILARLGPTHGAAIVKSLRDADKAHADLQKTRGEVAAQEQDYAGGLAAMVKSADYAPEAVQLAIQHAHQAGYEQQAQQLLPLLQPENQGKIKPLMDALIQQSPTQQKLLNEGLTATGAAQRGQAAADASQREAELQPLRVNEAMAKREQIVREQFAREHPQDQAAQQAALSAKERADKAQADREFVDKQRHEKIEEGQGAQRVAVEKGQLAVAQTNAGVDANGQPIQYTDDQGKPVNISPLAKQISEYKLPAPAARSYSSNKGLMNQVLAANPNFDIGTYEQRYQTFKDLRPGGKLGQQSLALNTLIRHSDDLMDAVGALGNGNFTPANAGYQKLRQLFGDSAPTNFDQLRQYVAGETVKLIRGGGGDQKDMENAAANINRAASPKQLMDALKVNFGIAGGKMQALNESVRSAIGQKDYSALDQGATDILKRRGYDTETMKPAAAAGSTSSYAATATGKDGHKIGTNDNGKTWFDVATGKKQ